MSNNHRLWIIVASMALMSWVSPLAQEPPHPIITKGLTKARLKERGAFLIDDFEAREVNENRWKIWKTDPDKVRLFIQDGRFVVEGHGQIWHNGLMSIPHIKYKDVVLVSRMDIKSQGSDNTWSVLHLCGGAHMGPDASVEITLEDRGEEGLFSIVAWVPIGSYKPSYEKLLLPRTGNQGFLAKLELNAGNNLCMASVHDGRSWRQIDEPIELLVRNLHCEIKMLNKEFPGSFRPPRGSENTHSSAWFDDVRLYPRPTTHPVLVRLVLKDSSSPLFSTSTGLGVWPLKFQFAGAAERSVEDLVVELWTADGKSRICAVQSELAGVYLLPLKDAPWEIYPQAGRIRLLLDGKIFGREVEIPVHGLEGLYPNDVWELVLE